MGDKSAIEWTDASWTPIRARNLKTGKVGWHCEHATTGCVGCYAEGMNKRLGTGLPFKPGHRKDIEIFLDEEMLLAPLRWKKPRMIFVCSMTDAFASFVKDEWLDKMFAVMALTPQHTYQVLTKRADRMRAYFEDDREEAVFQAKFKVQPASGHSMFDWPLRNVWLGVSTERQQEADERIPLLLQTPAAVRFISAEPLLGPIDLKRWMPSGRWGTFKGEPVHHQTYFMTKCEHCGWHGSSELCHESHNVDDADVVCPSCNKIFLCDDFGGDLDWVIVGGESGPGARPMHPDWARALRDQCAAADVPFFFKQWGEYLPLEFADSEAILGDLRVGGRKVKFVQMDRYALARVGKNDAGRILDSTLHNEFPQAKEVAFG